MKKLIFLIIISILLFLNLEVFALQSESAHFIFYYEAQDSSIIDTIKLRLENSYDRITGDLQLIINEKTKVHIYPTLQDFHDAIGYPNAPDWLVGMGNREIYAVSPLNPGPVHTYDEMVNNVFVHEFAHICTGKINYLPMWLNEGFACYEGGPYYSKLSVVSAYNKLGRIPGLDELNNFNTFADIGGYPFSLTIAYFIVENFGMDNMQMFIYNPDNYSVFSGMTKNEFQEKWFQYVNEKYLDINTAVLQNNNETISTLNFKLDQNYPNPFNPETVISYQLSVFSHATLKIYDLLGNEVAILVNEQQQPGYYQVKFSAGSCGDGSFLSAGVYVYKLNVGNFTFAKKLILIK